MTLAIDLMTIRNYDVFFKNKYHVFDKRKVLGKSAYSAQSQHEEHNPSHKVTRVLPHTPDPEW